MSPGGAGAQCGPALQVLTPCLPLAGCSVSQVEKESSPAGAQITWNLGTGRLGTRPGRWTRSPDVEEGPVRHAVPHSAWVSELQRQHPWLGGLALGVRESARDASTWGVVSCHVLCVCDLTESCHVLCVCDLTDSALLLHREGCLSTPVLQMRNRGALSLSRCAQQVSGEGCAGARICRRALGPSFQALFSVRAQRHLHTCPRLQASLKPSTHLSQRVSGLGPCAGHTIPR